MTPEQNEPTDLVVHYLEQIQRQFDEERRGMPAEYEKVLTLAKLQSEAVELLKRCKNNPDPGGWVNEVRSLLRAIDEAQK